MKLTTFTTKVIMDKLLQTEHRMVVTRDRVKRNREILSNGYKASIWDDDKDFQMDKSDGCTLWKYIMWMYTETHIKNG